MHPAESPEPESIDSAESHAIRARISELALVPSDPADAEGLRTRDSELITLVRDPITSFYLVDASYAFIPQALRLITHTPVYPDPQQLASQAETISRLIHQRDTLLQERTDDHSRWQAERDGWDRMAEALIGKRRAAIRAGIDDVSLYPIHCKVSNLLSLGSTGNVRTGVQCPGVFEILSAATRSPFPKYQY